MTALSAIPSIPLAEASSTSALSPYAGAAIIFSGILVSFVALLALCYWLMRIEWRPLAVARTVLQEAIRMKIAVAFILLLMTGMCALPFLMDQGTPLRYRMQTFMSYATGMTGFLLSMMTIFLSCGTLGFEIQDKRIWSIAVKPMDRGAYLLGKWLGIGTLNLILLCTAGTAIYVSAYWMARQPAKDPGDQGAVEEEILTARVAIRPRPTDSLQARMEQEFDRLRKEDPAKIEELGVAATKRQLIEQENRRWRHIRPGGRQTFVFDNLKEAGQHGDFVQLHYKVRPSQSPADGRIPVYMTINDREVRSTAKIRAFQTLPIPVAWIDPKGELAITVINEDKKGTRETSLSFLGDDELEIFYQVSSFEANLLRGLAVLWLKLSFLGSLGLFAASFLSFPVACLLGMLVYFMGSISGFLTDALISYDQHEAAENYGQLTLVIRWAASALTRLLGEFARYPISDQLADGRLVSWTQVFQCLGWIGVVWTGITGLLAWRVFRSRELGSG